MSAAPSFEELAAMTSAALERLFLSGSTPRPEDLIGEHRGRVLAASSLPLAGCAVQRLVDAPWMPWRGKSFRRHGEGLAGRNRLRIARRRSNAFDFRVRSLPSLVDGVIRRVLDYDVPGNPRILRSLCDEVVVIGESTLLGRGYLRWRGRARLSLYFALRRLDEPEASR